MKYIWMSIVWYSFLHLVAYFINYHFNVIWLHFSTYSLTFLDFVVVSINSPPHTFFYGFEYVVCLPRPRFFDQDTKKQNSKLFSIFI